METTVSKFERLLKSLGGHTVAVKPKREEGSNKPTSCVVVGVTDSLLKLKIKYKDNYESNQQKRV